MINVVVNLISQKNKRLKVVVIRSSIPYNDYEGVDQKHWYDYGARMYNPI